LPSRVTISSAAAIGQQPVHDELPVAHVVLFDLRNSADASKLHERVPGIRPYSASTIPAGRRAIDADVRQISHR
jgi:hypothetical protein